MDYIPWQIDYRFIFGLGRTKSFAIVAWTFLRYVLKNPFIKNRILDSGFFPRTMNLYKFFIIISRCKNVDQRPMKTNETIV